MHNSLTDTQPIPTRRTAVAPLLDLIRVALHERGQVTFRHLPAGGDLVQVDPCDDAVLLADDHDDHRLLTSIVYGLHFLAVADLDPRLDDAAVRHTEHATHTTLTAMGQVAR